MAVICPPVEDKTEQYSRYQESWNYKLKIIYVGKRFCILQHLTTSILKVCDVNAPSSKCITGAREMGKAACWQWPTSWGTPKPQPRQAGSSAWPFSCQPHDLQLYEARTECHPYVEIKTPLCRGKEQKIQQHRSLYSDRKLKMANSRYHHLLL